MRVLTLLVFAVLCPVASAQDAKSKARIAELERQIADGERRLAILKAELGKLKPVPKVAVNPSLTYDSMKIGDVGNLYVPLTYTQAKFESAVDDNHMLVRYLDSQIRVILKYPTAGLADNRLFMLETDLAGQWKVTETRKFQGSTYYVLVKQ